MIIALSEEKNKLIWMILFWSISEMEQDGKGGGEVDVGVDDLPNECLLAIFRWSII